MPNYRYSFAIEDGKKAARAQRYDVDASYKDLVELCGSIRGKTAAAARSLLERVAAGEAPIPYKRYRKKVGHRSELGGRRGRYPRKAAGMMLELLENAVANAKYKGLDEAALHVRASANKHTTYPRVAPKGRWARANYVTCRIEMVLA
jgi:large subunit ribosomal protein L22